MSEATQAKLAHHTFAPWRVDGDRRIVAGEREWREPLKWNRTAACDCHRRADLYERHLPTCPQADRPRVLVGVDPFEDWQCDIESACRLIQTLCRGCNFWASPSVGGCKCPLPAFVKATMHDVRTRLFRLIDATPNLDWLLFTSTPENIAGMLPVRYEFDPDASSDVGAMIDTPVTRPNLWLGVDIDDQATADERIPHLLRVPAAVRMVRYSGVGKVDLLRVDAVGFGGHPGHKIDCIRKGYWGEYGFVNHGNMHDKFGSLDLLLISGDVGSDARPCNLEHVRDAIRKAQAAGMKVWVERLGSRVRMTWREFCQWHPNPPAVDCDPNTTDDVRLRDPHGADPAEWPEDLRIWEVPT